MLPDERVLVCQSGGSRWAPRPWPFDLPGSVTLTLPAGPSATPEQPSIQVIESDGSITTAADTFRTLDGTVLPLGRPSDLCVDARGWLLDDGRRCESRVANSGMTGVLYGTPSFSLRDVLITLDMPNGVALSPDGDRLYVVETRTRRVWEFSLGADGEITDAHGLRRRSPAAVR